MLLTPKQVAERLSVSVRTVYQWLEEGRLPAVRLSERVTRVPEDAVEALVASATVGPSGASIAAESRAAYCPTCGCAVVSRATADPASPSERVVAMVRAHRDEILGIAERRRAENLRIFGSVARGDARDDSDLDILVDLKPHASAIDLAGLNGELEALLGMRVDVVPARSLKQGVRERAMAEAVPL